MIIYWELLEGRNLFEWKRETLGARTRNIQNLEKIPKKERICPEGTYAPGQRPPPDDRPNSEYRAKTLRSKSGRYSTSFRRAAAATKAAYIR